MSSLYRNWIGEFKFAVPPELNSAAPPKKRRPRVNVSSVENWSRTNLNIDFKTSPAWPRVEELEWVANVIKHAEGDSADKLRLRNPGLFVPTELRDADSDLSTPSPFVVSTPLSGDDLFVSKADYDDYVKDVIRFWEWFATALDSAKSTSQSLSTTKRSTTRAQKFGYGVDDPVQP